MWWALQFVDGDISRCPGPLLAQDESSNASAVFWSICLFLLVVMLFGATAFIRKRMSHQEDFHGEGFTLSDLRRLNKAGRMSDEEFEKAKQVLLAGLSKRTAPPADALSEAPILRSPRGPDDPSNRD